MLPLERQQRILSILKEKQAVTVEELCGRLYSSGATIRRDLQVLEHSGQLRRTHGGAVFLDGNAKDFPLQMRENENLTAKDIIAERALPRIRNGQTIFMDASSTVCQLAARLTRFRNLRIITNGLKTADILAGMEGITVYSTGGRLRENAKSFVGVQAMEAASRFNADLAFFSCRGIHPESGITDSTEEEADLKRVYIRQSRKAFLLCDSSKIGKQYFSRLGGLDVVEDILSNVPLGPEYIRRKPEKGT